MLSNMKQGPHLSECHNVCCNAIQIALLTISVNTGSNFGMCSSSGDFNVCVGFFFGGDLVFGGEVLNPGGCCCTGRPSFGGGGGGGSSVTSRSVGSNGRALDNDADGKMVFERGRGGTGGASSVRRDNDKLDIEKFIDFDFLRLNDFFRVTGG